MLSLRTQATSVPPIAPPPPCMSSEVMLLPCWSVKPVSVVPSERSAQRCESPPSMIVAAAPAVPRMFTRLPVVSMGA